MERQDGEGTRQEIEVLRINCNSDSNVLRVRNEVRVMAAREGKEGKCYLVLSKANDRCEEEEEEKETLWRER